MTKKLLVVGFDPEIFELIIKSTTFEIDGYIDLSENKNGDFNFRYLGNDEHFFLNYNMQQSHLVIITIDNPQKRSELYKKYTDAGYSYANIISAKSNISSFCSIGEGCIVQDLVNVSYNAKIGNNVKINTAANIMHDAVIGSNSTVAPGSTLLGYASIGECCFIGACTVVLPRLLIKGFTITGAGSVVTRNLEKGTYIGVPARRLIDASVNLSS